MVLTLKHNHERGAVCEPCNEAMGMYQCYWCGKWTFKENWGPGWIRCPKCKQLAPSVAERNGLELVNTLYSGVEP